MAQKIVIWFGVLCILAMGAYPPWIIHIWRRQVDIADTGPDAGRWKPIPVAGSLYGWIFKPPVSASRDTSTPGNTLVLTETVSTAQLDLERLGVEYTTVCLAAIGLAWSLRKGQ